MRAQRRDANGEPIGFAIRMVFEGASQATGLSGARRRSGSGPGCASATEIGTSISTGPERASVAIVTALSAMMSAPAALSVKLALVIGSKTARWSKTWWV